MLPCLRADLPAVDPFAVCELPCRAKLDQNEAPVDLPAELKREIAGALAAASWNRYLQPAAYRGAKARLAAALDLPAEAVALTVGGDQVIQAAYFLAGGPGRRARWFEPTYPFIPLAAQVTGTTGDAVVLGEDLDERVDAAAVNRGARADLVFLVAPNNPTGGMPARAALEAALADARRLVLLDEAYADFAGETAIHEAPARRNLIVARTLSKSLAARVRLGFAVAHPELVAAIERVYTAPYHLNALQLAVAERYGDILPHLRAAARAVGEERAWLHAALAALPGVTPRPSRANFLLVRVEGGAARAAALVERLQRGGVRVRDVSDLPGLSAHIRVSVGTREENELLVRAIAAGAGAV